MQSEVTQAEFAAIRGVQPPMVTRWKQRGLLVMNADGTRVRVAESMASLDASLHPGRGGDRTGRQRSAGGTPASAAPSSVSGGAPGDFDAKGYYSVEAAREKRASAQLKELELARAAGEVVLAAEARDATMRRVQAAKATMLALPRRMSPSLALESDPDTIERLLRAAMREVFAALAGGTDAADAAEDAKEARA